MKPRFSPTCDSSCTKMGASQRYSLKNKLGDRMIKQLLNSVIGCQCFADQLFASDKSRYFAQEGPIIVNYCFSVLTIITTENTHAGRYGGQGPVF